MDFEKLKPWNWFKHEQDSHQIPVTKSTNQNPANVSQSQVSTLWQLHRQMDKLFDELWHTNHSPTLTTGPSMLGNRWFDNSLLGDFKANLDVSGDDKSYQVTIDVPGMDKKDIDIELDGNTLTVKGCKQEKQQHKDKHFYRVERSYGTFQRTLSLPEDADQQNIKASLESGILTISIGRKALPNTDSKKITIN
ncbi:Hsp20/alpha crystallin family protein [Paraferrimonas sp. SM1919]|uniref:Hsp20/alpha crystallin family protein n=1 Tax=Paraferrimonas sp. SM1919 TaxID=2662263 RepID=UPI0013D3A0DD|nr:Hsp20/alpha crystallin family protein [Paraferrimonas sp. SM1919]